VYFEQCRQALSQLVDAERQVTGGQAAPAGLLRISMPTPYAHYRVLPLLPLFRKHYPQVQLDVHLSNRNIDFADEGYELAIRGRAPDDSSLIARKLEDAELVLAATPSYLKRAGKPKTLEDLQKHECIQFELPSTGRRIPWTFQVDGKDLDLATPGSYCCTEDVLGVATLARSGAGLVQTYRYILEKDLKSGELVELLPQFGGSSRPFILLYPHARHLSLRVRTFVDFLVEQLAIAGR
jgi:DNA-binding transcriptional LysR family regulator